MENLIDRKRRSEQMTPEEHRAFKNYVDGFPTKLDAALHIGLSRPTLNLVIIRGSGAPDTIKAIRASMDAAQKATA